VFKQRATQNNSGKAYNRPPSERARLCDIVSRCRDVGLPAPIAFSAQDEILVDPFSQGEFVVTGEPVYKGNGWDYTTSGASHRAMRSFPGTYPLSMLIVATNDSGSVERMVAGLGVSSSTNTQLRISINAGGTLRGTTASNSGTTSHSTTTGSVYRADGRNNVMGVIVRSTANRQGYLNGEAAATNTTNVSFTPSNMDNWTIGGPGSTTTPLYPGIIKLAAVFGEDIGDWLVNDWTLWPHILNPKSRRLVYIDLAAGGATQRLKVSELDALVQRTGITQLVSLDALLQAAQSATVGVDALLRALRMGVISVDALVQVAGTVEVSVDALVRAMRFGGVSLDACVSVALSYSAVVDALVRVGRVSVGSVDALVSAVLSGSASLDAVVLDTEGTQTPVFLDGLIRALRSGAVSLDTMVRETREGSLSLDAFLVALGVQSVNLDALVRSSLERGVSFDALTQATLGQVVALDALIYVAGEGLVSLDAILALLGRESFGMDALLVLAGVHQVGLDAIVGILVRNAREVLRAPYRGRVLSAPVRTRIKPLSSHC
jgi:hypothetical protein